MLGHDVRNLVETVNMIVVLLADAINFKIKSMQMHGMIVDAGV